MANLSDVVARLVAADLPVIFLDTCILLDVIRAIERQKRRCVEHAAGLLGAATMAPIRCNVVVSDMVRHEWGIHEQAKLVEAQRHLERMQDQAGHYHDACEVFGIDPGFSRANYAGHDLAARMHELSRRILDCSAVIDPDNECTGRAMNRVKFNLPPSKKGGEAKDCTILEESLEVCRRLKVGGFSRKLVFCTSNTNDYCDPSVLHANLAADFAAVGLQFTSNISYGFHEVTR